MVKLWSVSGFWRETQKRTDLEMKWVLIIEQVWAMSRSERKRGCVFFWVWAKRVEFVKWVLGLEDLAKKVWWVYGIVKMAIYKEWRSKEEANCGKKRLRTIPGFKRTGKRENIRVWFLIWWYKYFAVQFRISQFYFFNCVCEFLFITNKKFKF